MKDPYMDQMQTFSHLNKKLVLLLQGSRGRPHMPPLIFMPTPLGAARPSLYLKPRIAYNCYNVKIINQQPLQASLKF
jgi:hypothetical protein